MFEGIHKLLVLNEDEINASKNEIDEHGYSTMSPMSNEQPEIWRNQDERLLHKGLRVAVKEGQNDITNYEKAQIMGIAN